MDGEDQESGKNPEAATQSLKAIENEARNTAFLKGTSSPNTPTTKFDINKIEGQARVAEAQVNAAGDKKEVIPKSEKDREVTLEHFTNIAAQLDEDKKAA